LEKLQKIHAIWMAANPYQHNAHLFTSHRLQIIRLLARKTRAGMQRLSAG
jgi:hypothetical protein